MATYWTHSVWPLWFGLDETVVPFTGGKCVGSESVSFTYIYELIGAVVSMCHNNACLL